MKSLLTHIQIWLGLIFRPKSKKINDYLIRKFNEELNRRLKKFYDEVDLDVKDIKIYDDAILIHKAKSIKAPSNPN